MNKTDSKNQTETQDKLQSEENPINENLEPNPNENEPAEQEQSLEAQFAQVLVELAKQKEDNLKLRDANLELLVDMESLRKRTQREIEKNTQFAIDGLVKELIPFIDSLDLGANQNNANTEDLKKGIEMSLNILIKILEKNKVSFINPEINSELNPELHEAITVAPSDQVKHNHILEVMQKGIALNGRVIRSAKVIVATSS